VFSPAAVAMPIMVAAGVGEGRSRSRNTACLHAKDMRLSAPSANGQPHYRIHESQLSSGGAQQRNIRVALYSHDTLGLGHLRRNLLIAQALRQSHLRATNLLITGAYESNFFSLPEGVDCLTLPRLQKESDGSYASGQLAISVSELVRLRAEAIASALAAFDPDLLIVDKVPTGAFGEMLPALRYLADRGKTKCVLGIRDVLDDPATVRSEWLESSSEKNIADFHDAIWVYGDQRVYDPIHEYRWSSQVAELVRFTGYLDQSLRVTHPHRQRNDWIAELRKKYAALFVCTLGGGKDGYALAETFVEAFKGQDACGILLTGPFMPRELYESLCASAARDSNLLVLNFTNEADQLVSQADGIVAMAGYNTVSSILSFNKPALLVPRVFPRQEQWIRADRLAKRGVVDRLHPDALTPSAVRDWVARIIHQKPTRSPSSSSRFDLNGLQRIVRFASELMATCNGSRVADQREAI